MTLKRYVYNQHLPYASIDTKGEKFKINEGDIVLFNGKLFATSDGHQFALSEDNRKWFTRLYTEEEESYFIKLRHQAAIAAMQGLLSDAETVKSTIMAGKQAGIGFQTVVARNAVVYADALINELKVTS